MADRTAEAASPAAWPSFAVGRILETFLAERDRWALWLPVIGGCGILMYFALGQEPPARLGIGLCGVLTAGLVLARRHRWLAAVLALALAAAVGFALAQARTERIAAPMLEREIGPVFVEGRVIGVDILPAGARVVLDQLSIERLEAAETPARVRVRLTRKTPPPDVGSRIKVLVVLNGPSPPVMPGAYDFRRHAFFERIGGIGYAVGLATVVAPAARSGPVLHLEALRQRIGARIHAVLDGDTAAIAAALVNGERGAISTDANAAMRDSGLAHLLSISGLHIGLVAALAFAGIRLLLAAVEPVALRRPIKKWAAAAALLVTLFYTLMVGAPVPTQRSFLMTGLVLLAVLVDRTAISMRLVAWAAVAVLAVAPDSVLGPSFQMSFGAVVALIAAYEAGKERFAAWRADAGWLRLALLYAGGVGLTTVIATTATTPFAAYHFQRIATYGLAANLVAVPLTSFWIMPCALLTYVLMPFGLEFVALVPMGWGIDAMLTVAKATAGWPGATFTVSAMPAWGIIVAAFGGLWLCLWRRPWRRLGVVAVVLGLASILVPQRPDILVGDDGRLVAVRDETGALTLSSTRIDRFTRDIWLRRDGQTAFTAWPELGPSADGSLVCDPLGCLYRRGGRTVALIRDPAAFVENCGLVDVIVASIPAPRFCRAPVLIDRFDVWRRGSHALTFTPSAIWVESVADRVGDRPWTLRR